MENRAVMGAYFLKEHLGLLGRIGCSVCLLGSVVLILHAPADKEVGTVDEILDLAVQPRMLPSFHPSSSFQF